jgi:hypothetical protein
MPDYYVRPDGNDSNTGLGPTYSQAWRTLSKAVSTSGAPKGSTIYFAPGFYHMKVTYTMNGGSGTTNIIGDPFCTKFSDLESGYVYWHCFGYYSDYYNLTSFDQNGGTARPDNIDDWYFSNIRFISDPAGGQAFGFYNCSNILLEKCFFESTGGYGIELTTKQNAATNMIVRNSIFTNSVAIYMSEPTTADLDCNIKFENCNMGNVDIFRGITGTFKQYGVKIYNCTVNQVQNLNYSGYTTANAFYIYNSNIHGSLRANAAGQIVNDYNRHFAYASLSNVTAGTNSYYDNNRRPTGYDAGASWLWGFKPKPYHSPVPAYFTNAIYPSDGAFPAYTNIRAMYQIYVTARVGGNIRFLDWDGATKTIAVTADQKYYLTTQKIKQIYNTGTTAQLIRMYLRPPSDNYGTATGAPTLDINNIVWDGAPSTGPQSAYTYGNAANYAPTSTYNKAINIKAGTISYSEYVQLNTTGLSFSTPGISASYVRSGAARVGITLVSQTVSGVWTSGGFVEVDPVNMPGLYRIDVPDGALASGANQVTLMIKGYNNTNGALVTYQFTQELMQVDMTQIYPNTNTAGTVGDALNAARSGAFGKRILLGRNINYYAPDEITITKTLELDSVSAPLVRQENVEQNSSITNSGLVFYLDAANSLSYPGTGTTWYDLSGRGNHASLGNGATWVSAGNRSHMSFDGIDDFLSFVYDDALFTNEATVIGWMQVSYPLVDYGFFDIGRRDNYYAYPDGNIYFGIFTNARVFNLEANSFNKAENHMVTVTIKPGTNNYKLYQNAVVTNFKTNTNGFTVSNVKGFSLDRKFKGKLFHVLLYNRALTDAEVTSTFNSLKSRYISTAPAGVDTNGLIMYLDASDSVSYNGTGSTWYDISGNQNHMTLINGPVHVSNGQASYFSFDATNDNASFVLNNTLSSTATLIIWLRKNTTVNNTSFITLGNRTDDWHTYGGQGYYSVFRGTRVGLGNGNITLNSSVLQDHMMAFSSSIGTNGYNVYQNGVLVVTDTGASIVTAIKTINSPFDGRIYAISIYNRALSQQEILAIYNSQKSRYGL